MEVTDTNIRTLSTYLQQTLNSNPEIRRPAEKFLESVEGNKNYPQLLLLLLSKQDIDITVRIAGAVIFKNFIRRNWQLKEECGVERVHSEDRESIKTMIVDVMIVVPQILQKQLSDAVYIIGKSDFPDKWQNLLPDMVEKFRTGDFHVINGILHTAHSLFKHYRYEFKSQRLWTEIKFVLDNFALPLKELLLATCQLTKTHADNPEALKVIYGSLLLISKIFYLLNFQDLPEFFEDTMETWMNAFHQFLRTNIPSLMSKDDEDASVLDELKAQICANLTLYAQKYDEEFQPYLPDFVTDVWNVLILAGIELKFDMLVSNALQFLSTVADRPHYKHLFSDPTVLTGLCEKVIIPNIQFRHVDLETFEDTPENYIRQDIEGSDLDTRRRAACDLVRVLNQHFEERITPIFSQYIEAMLLEYSLDPVNKWQSKNAAVYLVTSLGIKGQTQKHGATRTSTLVPLNDFYTQHILPELTKDVDMLPVIKADSIKYILMFRSVLPPEPVLASIPLLIKHLAATNVVVHSYAATTIDKILLLRSGDNSQPLLKIENIVPLGCDLVKALFNCLTIKGSEENEYVMRAIMRSFAFLQDHILPYVGEYLPKIVEKLAVVARNPCRPHFNHYLFETLTISIRLVCKKNVESVTKFEGALFPIFESILQQDVQEFLPYVLQILTTLMILRQGNELPMHYMALYPCLLTPVLWERSENIRPMTALLRTYIAKIGPNHWEDMKVSNILGVFQKLISSRANDHEGFNLIQSMMQHLPRDAMEQYLRQIFILLFQRLSSSKTTKFVRGFLVFCYFFVNVYGVRTLFEVVESIQENMFSMMVERIFVPDTQKVQGIVERKITAAGLVRIVTANFIFESHWWPAFMKTLISLFENPEDKSNVQDEHGNLNDDQDQILPHEVCSQLVFSPPDPESLATAHLQGIGDPKMFLCNQLRDLSLAYPGQVQEKIINQLDATEKIHLENYLSRAYVSLS